MLFELVNPTDSSKFVKCTRNRNGAAWAKKLGYRNGHRYAGGLYAWKGAGFKTEKAIE